MEKDFGFNTFFVPETLSANRVHTFYRMYKVWHVTSVLTVTDARMELHMHYVQHPP